jgi:hypothetical protein
MKSSMGDPGDVGALRHAVLTAAFAPENLPERVAAAGVVAATRAGGASSREFEAWGTEPSGSRSARDVGELAAQAYAGTIDGESVNGVARWFGRDGVVAATGIGAAARMFDGVRSTPGSTSGVRVMRPTPSDESRPTLIRIRRTFERVPFPWDLLAWEPRLLGRWWDLHEVVLAPGLLTAEEKRLAFVAVSRAFHLDDLARSAAQLLTGWQAGEVDDALASESLRVRRGVRSALVSIGAFAVGSLESERFELAAASMPAARAAEFGHILDIGTGLMVFASLS